MDVRFESVERAENFDLLLNVPLQISARLGACKLTVAELLKLGAGSVVQLDRPTADPVDLLVNDRLVARGEIVAVGEHFGVCITEVLRAGAA